MITVTDLTKKYARTTAVDHISFSVNKGDIVGFLGPNGAGKTTTMRMLTCFFPPTGGKATVAGFDVFEQSMEVRRRIGYLPEAPPLYLEMETIEYLRFVGRLKGLSGAELEKRVAFVLDRCAIADVNADGAHVMSSTQDIYNSRDMLAPVLGMPVAKIRVEYYEGSGVFGHGCYEDAAQAAAISSTFIRPLAFSIWASIPIRPTSKPIVFSIWVSSRSSALTCSASCTFGSIRQSRFAPAPSTTVTTSR